jgi:hypothetical protein
MEEIAYTYCASTNHQSELAEGFLAEHITLKPPTPHMSSTHDGKAVDLTQRLQPCICPFFSSPPQIVSRGTTTSKIIGLLFP